MIIEFGLYSKCNGAIVGPLAEEGLIWYFILRSLLLLQFGELIRGGSRVEVNLLHSLDEK